MPGKESLYPQDWFDRAQKDLERVERLLLTAEDLPDAGFHLQQALEKYLKGFLLSKGWKLRRIHDLEELLDDATKYRADFEEFRGLCQQTTEYYVEERYPFIAPSQLTKEEMEDSLKQARRLIKRVLE
jgi:HEPN domain-containing protein